MSGEPVKQRPKMRRIELDSAEYRRLRAEQAISFCPPIGPCRECGAPVVSGYCCWRCGTGMP